MCWSMVTAKWLKQQSIESEAQGLVVLGANKYVEGVGGCGGGGGGRGGSRGAMPQVSDDSQGS